MSYTNRSENLIETWIHKSQTFKAFLIERSAIDADDNDTTPALDIVSIKENGVRAYDQRFDPLYARMDDEQKEELGDLKTHAPYDVLEFIENHF